MGENLRHATVNLEHSYEATVELVFFRIGRSGDALRLVRVVG
jgi:hypothetical protein